MLSHEHGETAGMTPRSRIRLVGNALGSCSVRRRGHELRDRPCQRRRRGGLIRPQSTAPAGSEGVVAPVRHPPR
jgi:hypothetical protein